MSLTSQISSTSIAVVSNHQISSNLSGEAVVLNLNSGVYFGLNEVGASIWNLLQQPISIGEMRDAIVEEYEVEIAQCEQDLLSLLEDLLATGLIRFLSEVE